MFVDESGNPSPAAGPHEGDHFVLAGIALHERDVDAARMRVRGINRTSCPSDACAAPEFHSVDIWNNRGFFAKHIHPIPISTKYDLFYRMADAISRPEVSVIDVIVDKTRYAGRSGGYILRMAWSALFDRFGLLLDGLPGGPQWGVIVADMCDAGTRSLIQDAVDRKSRRRRARPHRCEGVVGDVCFRRSHDEEGIQMADGAAFMIRKHLHDSAIFRSEWGRIQSRHVPRHGEQRGGGPAGAGLQGCEEVRGDDAAH